MSELKPKEAMGCVLFLWNLCVTGPMWLVLVFTILNSLGPAVPQWAWILYFCYAPALIGGILIAAITKAVFD